MRERSSSRCDVRRHTDITTSSTHSRLQHPSKMQPRNQKANKKTQAPESHHQPFAAAARCKPAHKHKHCMSRQLHRHTSTHSEDQLSLRHTHTHTPSRRRAQRCMDWLVFCFCAVGGERKTHTYTADADDSTRYSEMHTSSPAPLRFHRQAVAKLFVGDAEDRANRIWL